MCKRQPDIRVWGVRTTSGLGALKIHTPTVIGGGKQGHYQLKYDIYGYYIYTHYICNVMYYTCAVLSHVQL